MGERQKITVDEWLYIGRYDKEKTEEEVRLRAWDYLGMISDDVFCCFRATDGKYYTVEVDAKVVPAPQSLVDELLEEMEDD